MQTPSFHTRSSAAAVAVGAFLILVFACAGPSWAIVWYRLSTDGLLTILWLLAAAGIGRHISRSFRGTLLGWVTACALGLGLMSLAVLGLGLAGWLNRATAAGIMVLGLVGIVRPLWRGRSAAQSWLKQPAGWGWLWLAAMPPLALAVIGALVPPGILWGDEPNGYDVVEYHLQIPREWYEERRITPLPENVFSYFPQGVEMHYLLAMELRGGPWRGMYLAQFMHAAMCALSVAAVAGAGGTVAGVIASVTPWLALLAPIAYVEGGVLLYGALAIAWAMRANSTRNMFIAGVMAGLACGVKLTSLPMLLIAIPLAARSFGVKRTAAFLAGALIFLSPWLIRTCSWTGNPVFPQAMNLFGSAHFSPVQVQRWRRAYLPTTGRPAALGGQILWDWRYGFVLLPAALAAGLQTWRSGATKFLLAMLLIILVVWLAFTHLQSRFFVLAIPICALLIAQSNQRRLTVALVCFLLACGMIPIGARLTGYLQLDRQFGLLGRENLAGLHGPDIAALGSNVRLDLVGDACPFWYQLPMSRLRYRTVFDVDASDPAKSVVEDWLNGPAMPLPDRLIVIDPAELARFSRTYYAIPTISHQELRSLSARKDVWVEGLRTQD